MGISCQNHEPNKNSASSLYGKTVLFLGSSVTFGSASGGVSFADCMAEQCAMNFVKEAVCGTTLADINENSYVARLRHLDAGIKPDLFVCQLSTNDVWQNVPLQKTEEAVRLILQYANESFACPIVFYTGTYFENEAYEELISLLYRLQKEFGFYILDLFHDAEMRQISDELYRTYMHDPVHPTLTGYREWWTPKFISFCENII